MIVVVEKIENETIDMITEDDFWFQVPRKFAKNLKEGSKVEIKFSELADDKSEEEFMVGGFVKNPPRKQYT